VRLTNISFVAVPSGDGGADASAWKPFESSDSTSGGRSTWFGGVLLLMIYRILAMTLYLLPPRLR
jgi:hypothetical protein